MLLQFNKTWKPLYVALALTMAVLDIHRAQADTLENTRDKPKITREAAMERLKGDYSLEGVAKKHIEVEYDDLLGLSQPLTQRTAIQAKNHPDAILVHPDLSIVLGAAADSYAFGFGLGTPARLPTIAEATHELHKGYLPIVKSRWRTGGFTLERTAFGILPEDEAVRTGEEKQDVMIRMAVTNDSDAPATTSLVFLVGTADGTQLENSGYGPLRVPPSRWQKEKLKVVHIEESLVVNDRLLLTYRTSAPTPVALQPKLDAVQGEAKDSIPINNGLCFDLEMKPKETRHLDFVVAGGSKLYPQSERARMAAVDFDAALQKAESRWDRVLEPGMHLVTPEPRLNNMYKHMVLACLANVAKEPNKPWLLPHHTPALTGWVWPWEFAYVSIPLDSLGFHKDTEACLQWFTEHQSGIGKHGDINIGPDGQVTSNQGCFVGFGSPRWMNETGSTLWMMAEHYRYSRDAEWLKANRDGILAACDWIKKQRETTRTMEADGRRVAHYGLLPKGRPHDWEGRYYYFCWTDGYTQKGLAETAKAFRMAGMPEAGGLSDDADDYRRCILDTLEKVTYKDPELGLLTVPNTVYFGKGDPENVGVWVADGPRALFDVGILDPVADVKYWQSYLDMTERRYGTLGGLMCHFGSDGGALNWKTDRNSPFWYVINTEVYWHRDFLARGEFEKALLVFYSSLAYGMSPDMFETVERVCVADSNYAPLSPNASSNGRALTMLRRIVIDEQDEAKGTLWLLRGCPRRWFAPGKSIDVSDAPTVFGKTALHTTCTDRAITIEIDSPKDSALKQLCVAVRHPDRKIPIRVTVNGEDAAIENEIVTVKSPSGQLRIVAEYD
jgi:hypothetical protein